MFGISGEHLVILAIVLIVFGPKRLPELGNTLGRALRNFKDSLAGVEEAKFRRIEEAEKAAQAAKNTDLKVSAVASHMAEESKTTS